MTKEELERLFDTGHSILDRITEALEQAWVERDDAIKEGLRLTLLLEDAKRERDDAIKARDFLTGQNTELLEDLAAIREERGALRQEREEGYGYLFRLLTEIAPQCQPLDTLLGLATQLDNCFAGRLHDNRLLNAELQSWRSGGLTEELLRRGDGYIKVGRGCLIISEHYLEEKEAEIAAFKAQVEGLEAINHNLGKDIDYLNRERSLLRAKVVESERGRKTWTMP